MFTDADRLYAGGRRKGKKAVYHQVMWNVVVDDIRLSLVRCLEIDAFRHQPLLSTV